MKFITQKTSNPLPYDEPVTTVALEIAPGLVIHFDGVWHDDFEIGDEGDRKVEDYVKLLKESLDKFIVERLAGMGRDIVPDAMKKAFRQRLEQALKDNPLP
jgi:hypothetical protein